MRTIKIRNEQLAGNELVFLVVVAFVWVGLAEVVVEVSGTNTTEALLGLLKTF